MKEKTAQVYNQDGWGSAAAEPHLLVLSSVIILNCDTVFESGVFPWAHSVSGILRGKELKTGDKLDKKRKSLYHRVER